MPDNTLSLAGKCILTARHIKTGQVIVKEAHNLITDVGKALVGDMLIDEAGYDTGLTYCALGAGDTAVAAGQTQLVDEGGGAAMRKTITSKTRADSVLTLNTFFPGGDCVISLEEAGIFGHDAGAAENSGVMFSRWLISFDNSLGDFDITISYELTIGWIVI